MGISVPRLSGLSLATLLAACAANAGGGSERTSHMQEHFQRVVRIQEAIVQADLDATRGPATWIAEHQRADDLPAQSVTLVSAMRARARDVAAAPDLAAAADATARMGRTCGACHAAFDGGPNVTVGDPPPVQEGITGRMRLHVWGADRLWEALIGPSEEAWGAGVGALQEAAMVPADLSTAGEPSAMVSALAREVRALTGEAARTGDWDDRTEIYGQLLAACGRCHELVGRGGGRSR